MENVLPVTGLGELRVDGVERSASPGANDKARSEYSPDGSGFSRTSGVTVLDESPGLLVSYWTLAGKLEVFAERSEIWPVHVQWPSKLKLRWTRCPAVLV